MKHIRLFEGFDTDEYYQKISYDEYCSTYSIDFEYKYYDKLNRYYRDEVFSAEPVLEKDGDNIKMVDLNPHEVGYRVTIYQGEDEWFFVAIRDFFIMSYFKCDQYEGLIKCLDEEIEERFYED